MSTAWGLTSADVLAMLPGLDASDATHIALADAALVRFGADVASRLPIEVEEALQRPVARIVPSALAVTLPLAVLAVDLVEIVPARGATCVLAESILTETTDYSVSGNVLTLVALPLKDYAIRVTWRTNPATVAVSGLAGLVAWGAASELAAALAGNGTEAAPPSAARWAALYDQRLGDLTLGRWIPQPLAGMALCPSLVPIKPPESAGVFSIPTIRG